MNDKIFSLLDRLPMATRRRTEHFARLGDGHGGLFVYNPDGTQKKGYVYAWVEGIGITEVRCRNVVEQAGWPVLVGEGRDGVLEVIEEDAEEAIHLAGDMGGNVAPHRLSHRLLGSDPDVVEGLRFRPLLTTPTNPPSLSVYIEPYHHTYQGERQYWPGGEVDLTSEVPITSNAQVLIITYLDPATNTASYVAGTELVPFMPGSTGIPFTGDDIAELDTAGYIASVALRLYVGQTEILWTDLIADVRDQFTTDGAYLRFLASETQIDKYIRHSSANYRRYYYWPIASFDPGASGATWTPPDSNTLSGWQLDAAGELLHMNSDVRADWDEASDLTVKVTFTVNIDNSGGGSGDTVDLKLVCYYKGEGDTVTKSQTVEDAITVGQCAQYTQFKHEFTIDYDYASNVVEAGDVFSFIINLETDTSEVTDITINYGAFYYPTKHVGIESGDT